jgi:hypothetical protein
MQTRQFSVSKNRFYQRYPCAALIRSQVSVAHLITMCMLVTERTKGIKGVVWGITAWSGRREHSPQFCAVVWCSKWHQPPHQFNSCDFFLRWGGSDPRVDACLCASILCIPYKFLWLLIWTTNEMQAFSWQWKQQIGFYCTTSYLAWNKGSICNCFLSDPQNSHNGHTAFNILYHTMRSNTK